MSDRSSVALFAEDVQNCDAEAGSHDQQDPQSGVVAGLGSCSQRHGIVNDLFGTLTLDGHTVVGGRSSFLFLGDVGSVLFVMPLTLSNDMIVLIYIELNGDANRNINITGAFCDTDESLGLLTAANSLYT